MIGRIGTVVRKELRAYFDHATAYILLVVFLGINGFFFFQSAYELGEASLRPMLGLARKYIPLLSDNIVTESLREIRAPAIGVCVESSMIMPLNSQLSPGDSRANRNVSTCESASTNKFTKPVSATAR